MRRILFTISLFSLLAIPASAIALTGDAARFDWALGKPAITADNTTACSNQAIARFDWVLGQSAVVYDSTATCTVTASGNSHLYIKDDSLYIKDGSVYINQ